MLSHNQDMAMFVSTVLLKSLVLFAATAALLVALRRSSASKRALAWQMCLFGMLLLPVLSAALPSLRIAVLYASKSVETSHLKTDQQFITAASVVDAPVHIESHSASAATSAEAIPAVGAPSPQIRPGVQSSYHPGTVRRLRLDMLAGILWTLGAGFLMVRIGCSGVMLSRLRRGSIDAPHSIAAVGRELTQVCGIRRTVRLMIGRDAASSVSPMTWGWARPVILLPAEAAEWRQNRLRPVLLHELGHVARCDWPVLILADLAGAVYWFHPLVWMMRRRLRIECEQACDDSVLAHGLEPAAYASLLFDIARTNCSQQRRPTAAAALAIAMASGAASSSMLEKRMRSVLQTCRSRRPVSVVWTSAALLLVALLVSPLSAARLVPTLRHKSTDLSRARLSRNADKLSDSNLRSVGGSDQLSAPDAGSGLLTNNESIADSKSAVAPLRSAPPVPTSSSGLPGESSTAGPAKDMRDVIWGDVKDGLQAGIRIKGPKQLFTAGHQLGIECFLRNVSKKDIAFVYGADYFLNQVPEVWSTVDSHNPHKAGVIGVFLSGVNVAQTAILGPGEAISCYSAGLALGKNQVVEAGSHKTGLEEYPCLDDPIPGPYVVRQDTMVQIMKRSEIEQLIAHRFDKALLVDAKRLTVIGREGGTRVEDSSQIPLPEKLVPIGTGMAPFEIGPVLSAPASADTIAWGKPASGLQAGLRSTNNRRLYRIGETVEMDYIVRNVTDKPITFEHDVTPGVAGVISDIIDSHGKPAYTLGLPVLHTAEMVTVTLQPGEMTVIGKTRMGLLLPRGSLNDLESDSKASNWAEAPPGDYQIRHLDTLYFTGDRTGKVTLYTGYLPLSIEPRTVNASWGKTIDGLRAGLAMHDNDISQIVGKEIHTDLYVSNTSSHEITISYILNDDKFFVPDLWNARRQLITPDWRNTQVEQKVEATLTLKPGEIQCIAHPFFTVASWKYRELAGAAVTSSEGTWFVNQPGKFTVRMTEALISSAADSDAEKHGKPHTAHYGKSIWSYYPTGEVSFELTAK